MSKIDSCKISGRPIFQGKQLYSQVTTINMYLVIKIRRKFQIIICYVNYIEVEKTDKSAFLKVNLSLSVGRVT